MQLSREHCCSVRRLYIIADEFGGYLTIGNETVEFLLNFDAADAGAPKANVVADVEPASEVATESEAEPIKPKKRRKRRNNKGKAKEKVTASTKEKGIPEW